MKNADYPTISARIFLRPRKESPVEPLRTVRRTAAKPVTGSTQSIWPV